jgi:hypothetical protein
MAVSALTARFSGEKEIESGMPVQGPDNPEEAHTNAIQYLTD